MGLIVRLQLARWDRILWLFFVSEYDALFPVRGSGFATLTGRLCVHR
jgi:hypothetical protein